MEAVKLHVELLHQGAADPELAKLWLTERLEGLGDADVQAHLFLKARGTVLELQWGTGGLTPVHLREAAESVLATPEGAATGSEAAYRSRYGAAPVAS
jgi:hypothetical protein